MLTSQFLRSETEKLYGIKRDHELNQYRQCYHNKADVMIASL